MMLRKVLTGLAIGAIATGGAFAQEHTVTVDIGPMLMGALFAGAGDMLGEGASASGFGIAPQYEYQLTENFTVGGRFAYMGLGMSVSESNSDGDKIKVLLVNSCTY